MTELEMRTLRRALNGRRALSRRRRQAGMTLVEIMIVVIIMALIATAVGVAVLPRLKQARIDSTRTDARTVAGAVEMYVGQNSECPTMEALVQEGFVNSSTRTTDAWDNAFQINCEGDSIEVVSAGPDGQMGTDDDIR
jgi:general secretion pathway protein G